MRKLFYSFIFLLCITFLSCSQPQNELTPEDEFIMDKYDNTKSIFENIPYLFEQAKMILGDDVRFYLLSGIQKNRQASYEMNLEWNCFFILDEYVLDFDISKLVITKKTIETGEMPPMGYSFLSEDETYFNNTLNTIWGKCILENNKPILNCSIYKPLVYPIANSLYFYAFSKTGGVELNEDYFVYNINTGEKVEY